MLSLVLPAALLQSLICWMIVGRASRERNIESATRPPLAAPLGHASRATSRPVYPFSVIRSGAYNATELKTALALDVPAARHYADFRLAEVRTAEATDSPPVYVSFRKGDSIYWTRRPIRLSQRELLLTDGEHYARARCGNRISTTPQFPTTIDEPAPSILDGPELDAPESETPDIAAAISPEPSISDRDGSVAPPAEEPFAPPDLLSLGLPRIPTTIAPPTDPLAPPGDPAVSGAVPPLPWVAPYVWWIWPQNVSSPAKPAGGGGNGGGNAATGGSYPEAPGLPVFTPGSLAPSLPIESASATFGFAIPPASAPSQTNVPPYSWPSCCGSPIGFSSPASYPSQPNPPILPQEIGSTPLPGTSPPPETREEPPSVPEPGTVWFMPVPLAFAWAAVRFRGSTRAAGPGQRPLKTDGTFHPSSGPGSGPAR